MTIINQIWTLCKLVCHYLDDDDIHTSCDGKDNNNIYIRTIII